MLINSKEIEKSPLTLNLKGSVFNTSSRQRSNSIEKSPKEGSYLNLKTFFKTFSEKSKENNLFRSKSKENLSDDETPKKRRSGSFRKITVDIISTEDMEKYFKMTESLSIQHKLFLNKIISKEHDLKEFIEIFSTLVSNIEEMYIPILENYHEIIKLLTDIQSYKNFQKTYQELVQEYFEVEKENESFDVSLESLVISMIQRPPRYELFLKELQKKHDDERLNQISQELSKVNSTLNDKKWKNDSSDFIKKFEIFWVDVNDLKVFFQFINF
jgi:hypothetical protein